MEIAEFVRGFVDAGVEGSQKTRSQLLKGLPNESKTDPSARFNKGDPIESREDKNESRQEVCRNQ